MSEYLVRLGALDDRTNSLDQQETSSQGCFLSQFVIAFGVSRMT
jgi:hypothetical protein